MAKAKAKRYPVVKRYKRMKPEQAAAFEQSFAELRAAQQKPPVQPPKS